MKFIKAIGWAVLIIFISIILFLGILVVGNEFIIRYGNSLEKLKINDIIIYIVYIIQLVVTAILSFLVYNLSRSAIKRELKNDKVSKINALKYVKNEVNYNKSIITVLKLRKVNMDRISKHVFKMDAWNKYSVILIDLLSIEQYNKILSYYSTIQLYGLKELEDDIILTVEDIDELMMMLDSKITEVK
jgi:heme/copper-type cytochrome/quinol oxidase subunit 2